MMEDERFYELLNQTVYGSGFQLKYLASQLDMSPSELSRMVSNNGIRFPADKLIRLIQLTGKIELLEYIASECGFRLMPAREPIEMLSDIQKTLRELKQEIEILKSHQKFLRKGEKWQSK